MLTVYLDSFDSFFSHPCTYCRFVPGHANKLRHATEADVACEGDFGEVQPCCALAACLWALLALALRAPNTTTSTVAIWKFIPYDHSLKISILSIREYSSCRANIVLTSKHQNVKKANRKVQDSNARPRASPTHKGKKTKKKKTL